MIVLLRILCAECFGAQLSSRHMRRILPGFLIVLGGFTIFAPLYLAELAQRSIADPVGFWVSGTVVGLLLFLSIFGFRVIVGYVFRSFIRVPSQLAMLLDPEPDFSRAFSRPAGNPLFIAGRLIGFGSLTRGLWVFAVVVWVVAISINIELYVGRSL